MRSDSILAVMLILLWAIGVFPNSSIMAQTSEPNSAEIQKTDAPKPPLPDPKVGEPSNAIIDQTNLLEHVSRLSQRLIDLKGNLAGIIDTQGLNSRITTAEQTYEKTNNIIKEMQSGSGGTYTRFVQLKSELAQQRERLRDLNDPVTEASGQLMRWRKEWVAEKERLQLLEKEINQLKDLAVMQNALSAANRTVDEALELIEDKLIPVLNLEQATGDLQAQLYDLTSQINATMARLGVGGIHELSPPMFSAAFWQQLKDQKDYRVIDNINQIEFPGRVFWLKYGGVLIAQVLSCFVLSLVFVRNRAFFQQTRRGAFLGQRPYSAGVMTVMLFFAFFYHPGLPVWRLLEIVVILVCLVRLAMIILPEASEKGALTVLMVVFLLVSYMYLVAFPVPFHRLLVVGIALVGFGFCWRHTKYLFCQQGPTLHIWGLRAVAMMAVVIVVAEIIGYHTTALYLLRSSIASIFCLLAVWIIFAIINSLLEMALVQTPLSHLKLIGQNNDLIIRRLNPIIAVGCGVLLLDFLLVLWDIYPSMLGALEGVLSAGFNLGEIRINVGWALTAVAVVYVTFLLSWMIQALLLHEVLPKRRVTKGVQVSISKLVHYAILLVGFMVGLRVLGFDLTNMAILGGAVGVGVGFGLQAIINNFASGLILLFERPIKVGDSVQMDTDWGEVKKMGLRATVIQTYDNAEIVVPNSDLITNRVINWTLTGRRVRVRIPVGVAYGTDVNRVVALMLQCAKENVRVLNTPAPQVLFLQFGDSSLDFELRAWVAEFDIHLVVKSELNMAIDRLFRQEGIEIPFPQRDLHLRSVDTPAVSALSTLNPDEGEKV